MAKTWIVANPMLFKRDFSDFHHFANALPDPNGSIAQWLETTQIVPIWIREFKSIEGWHSGHRSVDHSAWFYFMKGKGQIAVGKNEQCFRFRAGDLVLIPKGTPYSLRFSADTQANYISIFFHAYVFGSINLLDLVGFPLHIPGHKDAPYESASKKALLFFATKALGWSQVIAAEIFSVLVYILCHHGKLFTMGDREKAHVELIRILPSLKLIEDRLTDPLLNVKDLARAVSLSEGHFRNLFQNITGMSPICFVQRRRIEHACIQLRRTRMSIKEIAEASGFLDIVFFYRVFKKRTKTTPANYRNGNDPKSD